MSGPPNEYERHQIESLLQSSEVPLDRGVGMFLMPDLEAFAEIFDAAVAPAMRANGLNEPGVVRVFGSESLLSEICRHVQTAELIVADVTGCNPDLMYVLGMCHGFRRCPLLISRAKFDIPFNLAALRCIGYETDKHSLWELREELTRAIRIFLTASRNGAK